MCRCKHNDRYCSGTPQSKCRSEDPDEIPAKNELFAKPSRQRQRYKPAQLGSCMWKHDFQFAELILQLNPSRIRNGRDLADGAGVTDYEYQCQADSTQQPPPMRDD